MFNFAEIVTSVIVSIVNVVNTIIQTAQENLAETIQSFTDAINATFGGGDDDHGDDRSGRPTGPTEEELQLLEQERLADAFDNDIGLQRGRAEAGFEPDSVDSEIISEDLSGSQADIWLQDEVMQAEGILLAAGNTVFLSFLQIYLNEKPLFRAVAATGLTYAYILENLLAEANVGDPSTEATAQMIAQLSQGQQDEVNGQFTEFDQQQDENSIPDDLRQRMETEPVENWAEDYLAWAAVYATASVPDDPQERLRFTQRFYENYGYAIDHQFPPNPYGYGKSHIDFVQWEFDRGVLNSLNDPENPGSPWWRAINAQLTRDMVEASLLFEKGLTEGSNPAVSAWINYMTDPSPQSWYAAHDSSIALGYIENEDLALHENFSERVLMVGVMTRLMLAEAMANSSSEGNLPRIGVSPFPSSLEELAVPEGGAVDFIVGIPHFYPGDYPLRGIDVRNVMREYEIEQFLFGGVIEYAEVDSASVAAFTEGFYQGNIQQADAYFNLAVSPGGSAELREYHYRQALDYYTRALQSGSLNTNVLHYINDQIEFIERALDD